LRVVIGERGLKDGTIEVKWRKEASARNIPAANAGEGILAELTKAKADFSGEVAARRASRASAKGH
jgi:prolyl-tRNA synthetase